MKIFKKIKQLNLTTKEKKEIKEALLFFINENPIKSQNKLIFHLNYSLIQKPTFVALTILLVVILTGGTTYAAENSIPDDVLYPIKIHINEPTISVISFTKKRKMDWKAKQIERRLSENEKLIELGKLNQINQLTIEQRINEYIKSMEKNSRALKDEKINFAIQLQNQMNEIIILHQEFIIQKQAQLNSSSTPFPINNLKNTFPQNGKQAIEVQLRIINSIKRFNR